jgi:hypothetical protein
VRYLLYNLTLIVCLIAKQLDSIIYLPLMVNGGIAKFKQNPS